MSNRSNGSFVSEDIGTQRLQSEGLDYSRGTTQEDALRTQCHLCDILARNAQLTLMLGNIRKSKKRDSLQMTQLMLSNCVILNKNKQTKKTSSRLKEASEVPQLNAVCCLRFGPGVENGC